MKNFLKSGLLVAVAVMSLAGTSNAGILNFGGTTGTILDGSKAGFDNIAWTLSVTFTGAVTPLTNASITAATLVLSAATPVTYAFTGTPGTLTVNGGTDKIDIAGINLVNGGYGDFGTLTFSLSSTFNAPPGAIADEATVMALGTAIGSTYTGTFAFQNGPNSPGSVFLNGSVAAPEPGSIAVLCGLGLIVGRRVLKSRSSKKQEVAA